MKKLFISIALIMIILGLTACGDDGAESEQSSATHSQSFNEPAVDNEINASSEQGSTTESEPQTAISSQPQISTDTLPSASPVAPDYSLTNEMTVRVIDLNGNPVPNIGIYVEPVANKILFKSRTYAVSNNEGLAVLQRVRRFFTPEERVQIGLTDRNQSDLVQQYHKISIPTDTVTPIDIVWDVQPQQMVGKNQLTAYIADSNGLPVKNAWVSINLYEYNPSGINYGTGQTDDEKNQLNDRDRISDENGMVCWYGLQDNDYLFTVFQGKPSFSNVASEHPLLQNPMTAPVFNQLHSISGNQTITIQTEFAQDDYLSFKDYLESNLSDTDYAYIQIGVSGKDNIIWITNQGNFDSILASYSGKIPKYEVIITSYSKNDIDKAIEKISSTEIAQRGFQQKKISTISCYEGFMNIVLNSNFPELEEYAVATYGDMVRIYIVEVNPTT